MATDYNIKITASSKSAESSIDKLDKKGQALEKRYNSLSRVAGKVFTTRNILGATAAIAGLTAVVGSLVNTYKKQEQAEIRTRQTLKATGFAAGLTAEELFKMASSLQAVTTFGDETILSGQNLLLTFRNIGKDTFPRATEAMLDMATAMDTGLKEAAIQLGKALNDPTAGISALTRVGITFTAEQKNMIKEMQDMGDTAAAQSIILSELENQFGGVARAARQGTGSITAAGNAIGDLFEEIGKAISPTTSAFANFFERLAINLTNIVKRATTTRVSVRKLGKEIETLKEKEESLARTANISFLGRKNNSQKALESIREEIKAKEALLKTTKKQAAEEQANRTRIAKAAAANKKETDDLRLNQAQELADKLYAIRASNQERLRLLEQESVDNQTVFDDEVLSNKILRLEEEQQLLADMKLLDQAKELSKKGQHEKALQLLERNTTKTKLAELKLKEKANKQEIANLQGTLGVISTLTSSSNKALFNIGKAAALANHAVNVPAAISKALASAPPPFNFVLAGLVGTAMAVQGAQIASQKPPAFAEGGMVTGGIPNQDSVPATLMPGELVVPTKNFEEVVGAVQNQRANESGVGGGEIEVVLTMNDNVMDFIEAQVIERRALGTGAI